jgi:hypothetical protein
MNSVVIVCMLAAFVLTACSRRRSGEHEDFREDVIIQILSSTNTPETVLSPGHLLKLQEYQSPEGITTIWFIADKETTVPFVIKYFDTGEHQFRVLVGNQMVVEFVDEIGMGYGKGGGILRLRTKDRAEAKRVIAELKQN